MITKNVMGIIFPNVHDDMMSAMTAKRAMGSVPFAARYRLIDFSLSNLVNAGIVKVGIIAKSNYQSLMDHLGSGKPWDLDRKNGGLYILPPYGNAGFSVYTGHVDALAGVMDFLKSSVEQYVVLCDADVISNFDLESMIESHIQSGADATIAYKKGKLPYNHRDIMSFSLTKGGRVKEIRLSTEIEGKCNYSLDVVVIERNLLINLVNDAFSKGKTSLAREVFQPLCSELKICGWEVTEYATVMDSEESYTRITNELLMRRECFAQLFNPARPVYTKTRDDMPTKYGLKSSVTNSIVADGCVIDGVVKNCVLFRGVKVNSGALLENCIIMQDGIIGENTIMRNVTTDKKVVVGSSRTLNGAASYPLFIRKGEKV